MNRLFSKIVFKIVEEIFIKCILFRLEYFLYNILTKQRKCTGHATTMLIKLIDWLNCNVPVDIGIYFSGWFGQNSCDQKNELSERKEYLKIEK